MSLARFMIPLCAVVAVAAAPPQAQAGPAVTKEERAALIPVQQAVTAKDWAAAQAALTAALPVAKSPGALYAVGRFRLEIGLAINNPAMQLQGLDGVIASGQVPAADLAVVYRNQGVLAKAAGDKAKAEAAFAKVAELSPNDPEALIHLAQAKMDSGKPKETVTLISRAIDMKRAAGQAADESWYKYALKLAYDGRSDPVMRLATRKLSGELVMAYPTKENWRDSLLIFRDTSVLDPGAQLDLLRFMRASGALAGERDWYDLASGLSQAGYVGEAKAVVDDGIAKKMIDPNKAAFAELLRLISGRIAGDRESLAGEEAKAKAAADGTLALKIGDAWYGYGENERAMALYRAALGKGGVDANLVNLHLAMAMVAAGDRAGAETIFKSLTGVRGDLGAYWVQWLHR